MPDAQPLFTFVHVTDTHFGRHTSVLEAFVEAVNRETHFPLPDWVVHTGDIITGYNETAEQHYEQMREAKALLDKLRVPALFACHNHDTYGEDVRGTVFDDVFGAPHVQEVERGGFYMLLFSGAVHSSDVYGEIPTEGPSKWGFDVWTQKGRELLRERLRRHEGQRKLVFTHTGLVSPRREPMPADSDEPLPARSGFGYCMSEERAALVRPILAEEGVVAHYCGHSHINARHEVDGVAYVSTSSLANYPGEARHVEVYPDRLIHRMIPVPGGRDLPMRWSPNLTDADHPTNETYFAGNPEERDFTLALK